VYRLKLSVYKAHPSPYQLYFLKSGKDLFVVNEIWKWCPELSKQVFVAVHIIFFDIWYWYIKYQGDPSASLTVFCTSRFFLNASVLPISNFGCKENNLSTLGFIMVWILSKLQFSSVLWMVLTWFVPKKKNSSNVPSNLPDFYFSISAFSSLLLLILMHGFLQSHVVHCFA
jgi:hypothetical protein